jgi:hypothetical protein
VRPRELPGPAGPCCACRPDGGGGARLGAWSARGAPNRRQLFVALHEVATDPPFSADGLAAYIRRKAGISRDATDGRSKFLNPVNDAYVEAAQAVRDHLKADGL